MNRRKPWLLLLAALTCVNPAGAADYYVSPLGSGEGCTRATPCELGTGVALAQAGDAVVLQDGVYKQGIHVTNSGTPEAWITFRADECALPIIEGEGEAAEPDESGYYPSGVYVAGEYIRFIGIVSRHWDSGFANVWTGNVDDEGGEVNVTPSNGHLEYVNCIGDGNHRTAFAMYSASGLLVRESIAAHSGGSPTHSWSSGIQLYAVQGAPGENVVERSVSFENVDAEKNNDGSGFIVDEYTENAVFVNNIGFGNGGSCMRLTRSPGTSMSHFSCYHNGRNPTPNSPTDPGEFYFTDELSRSGNVFASLLAASGTPADPQVFMHPPAEGFPDNVIVNMGPADFFSDPEGTNPDFRPPTAAAAEAENQATDGPDVDIGFDPKCVVKRLPEVPYRQGWWEYSIDYDYIRSLGGIAQCFHPKARSGGADMGAYELSGPPHEFAVPGSCVPSPIEPDPPQDAGKDDDPPAEPTDDPQADPGTAPSSSEQATAGATPPPTGTTDTGTANSGAAQPAPVTPSTPGTPGATSVTAPPASVAPPDTAGANATQTPGLAPSPAQPASGDAASCAFKRPGDRPGFIAWAIGILVVCASRVRRRPTRLCASMRNAHQS